MTAATTAFNDLLQRYAAAVAAKDVDAFVALYADDLRVFDLWGPWELSGIAAWRAMAAGWFASLGDEQLRVTSSGAHATASDGLLVGHATLTFTALSATGELLRSLDSRLTVAARPTEGGGWRIVHEHSSAPIHHETLKAQLRRAPTTATPP